MAYKKACESTFKCFPAYFCTPLQARLLLNEGKGRTLMLLIRHGATDWNMEVRLQGRQDIPLNEIGIGQAELTAQTLHTAVANRFPGCRVFTSPLSRAYDTARLIAEKLEAAEPQVLEELLERDYGSLEGMTYAERQKKYKNPSMLPDDMESSADATVRIKKALGKVRKMSQSEAAVVVTHGGVMNLLFSCITCGRAGCGKNITANCTVSLVAVGDREIIPLAYNLGGEELIAYIDEL